jgi:hypothetical protein
VLNPDVNRATQCPTEPLDGFRAEAILNHIEKAATATPASTGSKGTPLEIIRYDAKNAAAKK